MDIKNAKAVISGGASGLGLASAKKVIDGGGHAVIFDINGELGVQNAQQLGDRAMFIKTDISSEVEVQNSIRKAASFMDGISLAVNCAGVAGAALAVGKEGTMPGSFFSKTIQINLIGSFFIAKESANIMQQNKPDDEGERGVIISTASIAAFEGQIGQAAYSASKGGIIGMTLPLAREFARSGIRVNTIAPGIFKTPMVGGMSEELQNSLGKQIPFPPRLGRPEEFASLVLHIYENTMMNGETIRLDGAIRMQPK